jgi:hypothetical protein
MENPYGGLRSSPSRALNVTRRPDNGAHRGFPRARCAPSCPREVPQIDDCLMNRMTSHRAATKMISPIKTEIIVSKMPGIQPPGAASTKIVMPKDALGPQSITCDKYKQASRAEQIRSLTLPDRE